MTKYRATGKVLTGVPVTEHSFIGVASLDELEANGLRRPALIEDAKVKELKGDAILASVHALRDEVQRRFDKARRTRAKTYEGYIEGLVNKDRVGATPPITIYSPDQGEFADGELHLPYRTPLVVLDGETQTEARFQLRDRRQETGCEPVHFVLYHGISAAHAGTIMHDFNRYAHPIAEAGVAALNANGVLTTIIQDAIKELGIPTNRIARLKPRPKKGEIASHQGIMAGAVGALVGEQVRKSYGRQVALLNEHRNGHDIAKAETFVRHALSLCERNESVGKTRPNEWAVAGAIYHDLGQLLNVDEWLAMAAAHKAAVRRSPDENLGDVKYRAALHAVGLEGARA